MPISITHHRCITDDGLSLHATIFDAHLKTDALPVICLAGLTRNGRDFHQLANLIASDKTRPRRVIALDYRGRGHSDRDTNPQNYTVLREAQDVIGAMESLDVDHAMFIGTSRGGLIVHILAAMAPELLAGVILNDIGPVIEPGGLRQIRDYLSGWIPQKDWPEAVARLKATHQSGFPIFTDEDWRDMARALLTENDRQIVPDFDPAIIDPLKAIDFSKPLPDLWPQFELLAKIPMMVIRGEYSTLLSKDTLLEMSRRHGRLVPITATGQAHAPILHKYGLEMAIAEFLSHQP